MNKKDTMFLKWLHARLINVRQISKASLSIHKSLPRTACDEFIPIETEKGAFEREIKALSIILNQDCTNNSLIIELIKWFRDEIKKKSRDYMGDEVVIICIQSCALNGLPLNISVMKAFAILDKTLNGW